MQTNLLKLSSLGTPKAIFAFLNHVNNGQVWTHDELHSFFFNKIFGDRFVFDGVIPVLLACELLTHIGENKIVFNNAFRKKVIRFGDCKNLVLELFLKKLSTEDYCAKIFNGNNITQDLSDYSLTMQKSAFGFKYANIRRFLIDFEFFLEDVHFSSEFLTINPRWLPYFEANLIDNIRLNMLSLEQLKVRLENQEINGLVAEKFVLQYEKDRLESKNGIRWVAPYDASAGFDILSYHSKDDGARRFIEVKSFAGEKPYFYWSKNEIRKAEKETNNYFIYLVNRDLMEFEGYEPEVIINPAVNIFNKNSEWHNEVDKYYLRRK